MAPLRDTSAGHHHRTRSAVAAVGLERLPRQDQSAFHRIAPDLAARAGFAAFVVHAHSIAPHPVACCEPGAASSKAAGSPQAIPRSHGPPCSDPHPGADAPGLVRRKKMRLTDFCNRFPSRAPCGLLCFWPRLYAAPRLDGGSRFEAQAHPGPEPSGVRSWGDPSARIPDEPARWSPCLTAKLQLQPSPQPSREPPKGCLLARPGAVPRAPT